MGFLAATEMNNIWHQKLLDVKREAFIISANIKHNNKYDYSKFTYKGSNIKGRIICSLHGEFFQSSFNHLKSSIPCPYCDPKPRNGIHKKIQYVKKLTDIFINKIINGTTWWIKECPYCRTEIKYRKKSKLRNSIKKDFVCKKCSFHKITKSGYRYKSYIFPDGRIEMVQGYEPLTLNYLLSQSVDPSNIRIKHLEKPIIEYDYNGSEHKYYPDVFLSNNNTIIETKSTWTWNNEVNKNKSKIKGVIESGYNMRIIIWNGKHELVTDSFYSKQKSD